MPYPWKELRGYIVANKFLLTNYIDEGASSAVYEFRELYAQESTKDQVIALTEYPTDHRQRLRARQDLVQSLWLAHPNVVRTYEAGLCTLQPQNGPEKAFFYKRLGRLRYTLESVVMGEVIHEGLDLADLDGRLKLATQVLRDLGNAVLYLRYNVLTHFDINARNVMWNGSAWQLIDFESSSTLELSEYIAHIFAHISICPPEASNVVRKERAVGDGPPEEMYLFRVSPAWDLYCVGALLFHIVTNQLPSSRTPEGNMSWLTDDERATVLRTSMGDEPLADVILNLTATNPRDRKPFSVQLPAVGIRPQDLSEEAILRTYSVYADSNPAATHVDSLSSRVDLNAVLDYYESEFGMQVADYSDGQLLLYSDEVDHKLQDIIDKVTLNELLEPYELPPLILRALGRMILWKSKGRSFFVEDKVMLRSDVERVVKGYRDGDSITIQKTDYLKSLVTQELMKHEYAREFRTRKIKVDDDMLDLFELYVEEGKPRSADRLLGSSHIGISTLAFTRDGVLVLPTQGDAIEGEGQLVPAGSGSADWLHDTHLPDGRVQESLGKIIESAMKRELIEEGGLHTVSKQRPKIFSEGTKIQTRILGYGRLVARAFKPEFYGVSVIDFALSDFNITKDEENFVKSHNLSYCENLSREHFGDFDGINTKSVRALTDALKRRWGGTLSCALEHGLEVLIRDLDREPGLVRRLRF